MKRSNRVSLCTAVFSALSLLATTAFTTASAQAPGSNGAKYATDKLLVRFAPGTASASRGAAHAATNASVQKRFDKIDGLELVKLPPGLSVQNAIKLYSKNPNVSYVEPDFIVRAAATPDDPQFSSQFNLNSPNNADINAPEAWNLTTGSSSVIVAVVDSGVDYNHPDLSQNIYTSATDCNTNGVDNDGSGVIDDCHGADFANNDGDPMDDNGHGTHVAGTIGAVGNNTAGVAGVNWSVTILPCKFLDSSGFGTTSGAIACLNYIAAMKSSKNIVAVNASWGGHAFSQALYTAIDVLADAGVLFIAAAGDSGSNNDTSDFYPADYYLPNVISVAATTSTDTLASISNFGRRSVHVGAPGENILSTKPGNTYGTMTGTSMAAPHVTGVAALLNAQAGGPSYSRDWRQVRNLILAGGDNKGALSNTVTTKRLNAFGSLQCSNSTVASRLRPLGTVVTASVGTPVELAYLHIKCAAPNGNVNVTVNPGAVTLTLRDNGLESDQAEDDGVYSALWTPAAQGTYTLTFPGGEIVTATVRQPYSVATGTYSYRTITGTNLNLADDASAPLTSPFPIPFGGGSFTTLYVGSNGTVSFDGPFNAHHNSPLPTASIETLVAPFWDDLYTVAGAAQNVFWAVTGDPGTRELVIEWRDVGQFECADGNSKVKFQVVFFENKPDILFNYDDVSFNGACGFADQGASATVGVQVGSVAATQHSFNTASLTAGTALLWTLGATAPAISVAPGSIDFGNVAVGSFADRTFTVQNAGGGTLDGSASAASPFSIFSGSPFSLAGGASTSVVVRFTPGSATGFSGNISITSNGGNNSPLVSGTGVAAVNADLAVTALGNPPSVAGPGGSFPVGDTVKNSGTGASPASTTRYHLSADQTKGAGDIPLDGSRSVPALNAGQSSNGNATLTIPSTAALGTYYLLACADDANAVPETNEANNCKASTGKVQVTRPDLLVTATTVPAGAVGPGGKFKVTEAVKNQGAVAAGAFRVAYYLSTDVLKDGADVAIGSRSVASLNAGQSSGGGPDVTVPNNTSPGLYYVLTCADDPDSVIETNEANNCLASAGKLTVTLPDLVISAGTNSPAAVAPGGTFKVSETVKNQGTVPAGAFIVTYYFSADTSVDVNDVIIGNRPVSSLAATKTSSAELNVTVPANRPLGTYYVLICADFLDGIDETNEGNNCLAAPYTVGLPDLVTTAVGNPPATIAAGGSFKITDTVSNQGAITALASTTRYWLSIDQTKDGSDVLLTKTRAVGNINAGSSSNGNATVTVPAGTPLGTYYVLACADDLGVVTEVDDTNNCRASANTVIVQ